MIALSFGPGPELKGILISKFHQKSCLQYENLCSLHEPNRPFFIGITTHTSITKLIYACPTTEVTTSCSKVVVIDKN